MEGVLPFFHLASVSLLDCLFGQKKKKPLIFRKINVQITKHNHFTDFHRFLDVRFVLISKTLLQHSSILGNPHLYRLKEELLTNNSDRLLEVSESLAGSCLVNFSFHLREGTLSQRASLGFLFKTSGIDRS